MKQILLFLIMAILMRSSPLTKGTSTPPSTTRVTNGDQRPLLLNQSEKSRPLRQGSDRRPAGAGQSLQYLPYGGFALATLLDKIDSAQSSIDAMYYIFEYKHSAGKLLIAHLVRAAQKNAQNPGFKVRVLLDSYSQSPEDEAMLSAYLSSHGVDVRFFNDSSGPRRNNRNHIKFSLIDSKILITGSRNIADYHFGTMGDPGGPVWTTWLDKDVLIEGSAAYAARAVFDEYWTSSFTSLQRPKIDLSAQNEWKKLYIDTNEREFRIEALLKVERHRYDREFAPVQCENVRFIADSADFMYHFPQSNDPASFFEGSGDDNPMYQHKRTTKAVVDFLRSVSDHLFVENYAFQPIGRILNTFVDLRRAPPPVYLVTNQTEDTPQMTDLTRSYTTALAGGNLNFSLFDGDANAGDRWFRSEGVDYKIHSKVFVKDGKDAMISTFNLDARSYSTNWESAVLVENCPSLARQVEYDITRDFSRGKAPSTKPNFSSQRFLNKMLEGFY